MAKDNGRHHDREQDAQADERERRRDEQSALIGVTIRETAYATGHGTERISLDGGRTWHLKRHVICDGNQADGLTVRTQGGTCVTGTLESLIDGNMRRHDGRVIEEAEGRLRKISNSVIKASGHDFPLTARDWLWCLIALTDGDLILG